MSKEQSWESCKYAIGDLCIDWTAKKTHPEFRLLHAIFPESVGDKLLKENGVHRFYYCQHPKVVELGVYEQVGIPRGRKLRSAAMLFRLNVNDNYEGSTSADLFGEEERSTLDGWIKDGLKMCTHCKFYKPR